MQRWRSTRTALISLSASIRLPAAGARSRIFANRLAAAVRRYTPIHPKTLHIVKESTPKSVQIRRWLLLAALTSGTVWIVIATFDRVPLSGRTRLMPINPEIIDKVGSLAMNSERKRQLQNWKQLVFIDEWEQTCQLYARLAKAFHEKRDCRLSQNDSALLDRARQVAATTASANSGRRMPQWLRTAAATHATTEARATVRAWEASITPELFHLSGKAPLPWAGMQARLLELGIEWVPGSVQCCPAEALAFKKHAGLRTGEKHARAEYARLAAASRSAPKSIRWRQPTGGAHASFTPGADRNDGASIIEAMRWLEYRALAMTLVPREDDCSIARVCAAQALARAREKKASNKAAAKTAQRFVWEERAAAGLRADGSQSHKPSSASPQGGQAGDRPPIHAGHDTDVEDVFEQEVEISQALQPANLFVRGPLADRLQAARQHPLSVVAVPVSGGEKRGVKGGSFERWTIVPRKSGQSGQSGQSGSDTAQQPSPPPSEAHPDAPASDRLVMLPSDHGHQASPQKQQAEQQQRESTTASPKRERQPLEEQGSAEEAAQALADQAEQEAEDADDAAQQRQPGGTGSASDDQASKTPEEEPLYEEARKVLSVGASNYLTTSSEGDHSAVLRWTGVEYEQLEASLAVAKGTVPASTPPKDSVAGRSPSQHPYWATKRNVGRILPAFDPVVRFVERIGCRLELAAATLGHRRHGSPTAGETPYAPEGARSLKAIADLQPRVTRSKEAVANANRHEHVPPSTTEAPIQSDHASAKASEEITASRTSPVSEATVGLSASRGRIEVTERVQMDSLLETLVLGNLEPKRSDLAEPSNGLRAHRSRSASAASASLRSAFEEDLGSLPRATTPDEQLLETVGSPAKMSYFVVDSPVVNASCGVGGVVTTYTGLLRVLREEEERSAANLRQESRGVSPSEARVAFAWSMLGLDWNDHGKGREKMQVGGAEAGSELKVALSRAERLRNDRRAAALLSGIIAHELGHDIAGHVSENLAWMPFWLLVRLFGALLNPAAVSDMLQLGMMLPLSRQHEREADRIGTAVLLRACQDPLSLPRALSVLEASQQRKRLEASRGKGGQSDAKKVSQYRMTHPATPERVRNCVDMAREMQVAFGSYCTTEALDSTSALCQRCGMLPPDGSDWGDWCSQEPHRVAAGADGVWRGHGEWASGAAQEPKESASDGGLTQEGRS